MSGDRRRVVLVTGLSGAGKASILRVLEDQGFEAVDNPPLPAVEATALEHRHVPLAAGMDTRTRGFTPTALLVLAAGLKARPELDVTLVFATADEAVLQRRYSETRRRHPMALGGRVAEGIAAEAILLAPLREAADLVIDTSDLPLPELRRQIAARFGPTAGHGMGITVMSFGYPHGLPRDADLVLDTRFLRNPHYDPALRPLTGRDPAVAAFVTADQAWPSFWQGMTALLDSLLPRYAAEGKSYLTVAFGCTGGKHRSVLTAERLTTHLALQGWRVECVHRESAAWSALPPPSAAPAPKEATDMSRNVDEPPPADTSVRAA
ncbi:RNase adapter RapZ [Humitalea sp. 24SJ18S-53]|uniref:RNase adapter RapZ n=1 Tax=Humitalea sp. 24SJ18S-53 TaxID=3422307 RepID=UPI003D678DF4